MVDPISKRTHCYYKHKHKRNNKNIVEDSFFGPYGITSLATHATSTYYCSFYVNLFKTQNKLISHLTTWIGLTWPLRSLLQEADS